LNIPLLNPNLDNSSITTVYCSQQYGIALHKDNDHGLAFALWLLEHSERCHTKSRKCLEGWYFIFWDDKIAVPLQDCTFITWDTDEYHGTIPGQPKNKGECPAIQWAVAMQNQGKFIHACKKFNKI